MNVILDDMQGNVMKFDAASPYTVVDIQGLGPAPATINTSETPLVDGAKYNSSKVNMRTIDFAFATEIKAEEARLYSYKVLKPKMPIRLWYKSALLDVYIDGWIKSVTPNHFEKKQTTTVTIVCPEPYFKLAQQIIDEIRDAVPMFHFPFHGAEEDPIVFGEHKEWPIIQVINQGGVPTGMVFKFICTFAGPLNFQIMDMGDARNTFGVFDPAFEIAVGDILEIDTRQGKKSMLLNGVNIFDKIVPGSTWLQLGVNGGIFEVFPVDQGIADAKFEITINYDVLFVGV